MKDAENNCENCNGKGTLTHHRTTPETCAACGGTGKKQSGKKK